MLPPSLVSCSCYEPTLERKIEKKKERRTRLKKTKAQFGTTFQIELIELELLPKKNLVV